jgi:hypothetical protein
LCTPFCFATLPAVPPFCEQECILFIYPLLSVFTHHIKQLRETVKREEKNKKEITGASARGKHPQSTDKKKCNSN